MVLVITEKHCFYPDEFEYLTPDQWNLEYEPFEIKGRGGPDLTGWHILPDKKAVAQNVTVLHLHGNAQNMTAHLLGSYFLAQAGFRLITFDYRGYGRSQGRPSIEGVITDGQAVVQMLLDHPFGQDEPLTLFGQSMGAFVAGHLLARFPEIQRAVLEAGLISFRDLFVEVYPEAVVEVPDGFSVFESLAKSPTPKLFIHGTMDQVVPLSHTTRMYEASAEPKELLVLEGVGHIDALSTNKAGLYRERVVLFLSAKGD